MDYRTGLSLHDKEFDNCRKDLDARFTSQLSIKTKSCNWWNYRVLPDFKCRMKMWNEIGRLTPEVDDTRTLELHSKLNTRSKRHRFDGFRSRRYEP